MGFPAGLKTRDQVFFSSSAMIDYFLVWDQFASQKLKLQNRLLLFSNFENVKH